MQNTNTITAVQSTSVTNAKQLEQYNIASRQLITTFGYCDLKPKIETLVLGWISHDLIEFEKQNDRAKIFNFFQKLNNHIEDFDLFIHNNENNSIEIPFGFYTLFNEFSKKEAKNYFKTTMYSFLMFEIANDFNLRADVVYYISEVQEYVNQVFKAKKKFKTHLEPLQ